MGIVFLGTPTFAVPMLEALIAAGYHVVEVITQPDRPKGRHHEVAASPVKQAALAHNLPVYQPERIRHPECVEHLRALAPGVMAIVGYGQIIPQTILDIAPRRIVNVHASLLPELRGAAPIQWSIARGFTTTGVTTMQIDAGLDTGDILLRAETQIGPDETAPELSRRLSLLGADLLIETLRRLETIAPEKQDNAAATLAPILKKEDGLIDWSRTARDIHNQVRGLLPWPGAHTTFGGQRLHIWKSRVLAARTELPPGVLFAKQARIACGGGTVLEALDLQLEGRKRVPGDAFMNGLHLEENEILGAIS
jgi:methionyl-tRNA formyltransferase